MKRHRNGWIQLAVLVLLGCSVILTLLLPQLSRRRDKQYPLGVTVLIRGTDSDMWSNTRLGMEQAARELGGELRFLTLSEANDRLEQEELIRWEAENGLDVLVLVPAAPAQMAGRLKELTGGCPVVTLESAVKGAAATVAPDNEAMGQAMAQALLKDWTGGVVLLLDTAPDSDGIAARLNSARSALKKEGVPVLQRTLRIEELEDKLPMLTEVTGARWLMAFEPSVTERAAALKADRERFPALYGVGATAKLATWLDKGVLSATVAWSDYAVGYLAVHSGLSAVQSTAERVAPLPFFIVRGEDMYEPEMQKLLFPVAG